MKLLLLCLLLMACARSPEAELVHLLRENYANLEVNEAHKRSLINRLEIFLETHPLVEKNEQQITHLLNQIGDGHIKLSQTFRPEILFESGLEIDLDNLQVLSCQNCKPSLQKGKYPLLLIDGLKVDEWLKNNQFQVSASTQHGRRYRLLRSLQESAQPLVKNITVINQKHELTWLVKGSFPPCVSGSRMSEDIYRITVRNFWCSEGQKLSRKELIQKFKVRWDEAKSGVKKTDLVELDLRDNSGGGDEEVMYLLQSFFDQPIEIFHYQYLAQTQPGIGKKFYQFVPFKRWDSAKKDFLYLPIGHLPLRNSVHVLISAGCFSSCEIVAGVLKFEKRATLKGSSTHGGVGEPRSYPLGGGYNLMVPICRLWKKNGELYEGQGVSGHTL